MVNDKRQRPSVYVFLFESFLSEWFNRLATDRCEWSCFFSCNERFVICIGRDVADVVDGSVWTSPLRSLCFCYDPHPLRCDHKPLVITSVDDVTWSFPFPWCDVTEHSYFLPVLMDLSLHVWWVGFFSGVCWHFPSVGSPHNINT